MNRSVIHTLISRAVQQANRGQSPITVLDMSLSNQHTGNETNAKYAYGEGQRVFFWGATYRQGRRY